MAAPGDDDRPLTPGELARGFLSCTVLSLLFLLLVLLLSAAITRPAG